MNALLFIVNNRRFLGFGLACTLASNFGQTFFIALFGGHLRADFALSHAEFGAVYSTATLISAVVILWAGRLIDRVDLRVFTAAVFIVTGGWLIHLGRGTAGLALVWPRVVAPHRRDQPDPIFRHRTRSRHEYRGPWLPHCRSHLPRPFGGGLGGDELARGVGLDEHLHCPYSPAVGFVVA